MGFTNFALAGGLLAGLASADAIAPRQNGQLVTVDLSADRGVPDQLGSGILLGIPDATWPGMSADQIPDRFYEQIGFRYNRGGGSQLPDGAWVTGIEGYSVRLESTYSDYLKTRSFGVPYIIIPHDLWGTEQGARRSHERSRPIIIISAGNTLEALIQWIQARGGGPARMDAGASCPSR